ncbi:A24 family peptidase [Castellaniella sp.]|uniref:A24 family peptidase n=1 Tax=Castellaniella sp. TaxID=1955812 RepID=UPI002AFDD79F|nr:A24 family peptidase [Castellaniella sp.]
MGWGTMAGWAGGLFQELAPQAAVTRGAVAWGASGLAVAAGMCVGALLGRWAQAYADRLDAGEPATARTLWAAAVAAPSRAWRPVRDVAMALLLGLAAGLLAAGGGFGLVPLVLVLAALAWIDARSGLLPDALTLPLMAAGWLLGARDPGAAVGASALAWSGLAGMAWLYRRVRGRDGFGGGDVKCLAALAGWLGLEAAAGILWLACVLGLAGSLGRRGGWRRPYPFGPCISLAAGAWMLAPLAVQSWF